MDGGGPNVPPTSCKRGTGSAIASPHRPASRRNGGAFGPRAVGKYGRQPAGPAAKVTAPLPPAFRQCGQSEIGSSISLDIDSEKVASVPRNLGPTIAPCPLTVHRNDATQTNTNAVVDSVVDEDEGERLALVMESSLFDCERGVRGVSVVLVVDVMAAVVQK